ncbi:hypothetical protein Q6A77_09310 [Aliarcobacter skirrowii]|uniref:hypothetical protein n=1 Tax=Aliarcobacter skirrowii TaxID=28200 RepID=UPI0029A23828|nr:hypothetical protein [Aliarcobacter skirrowii]MDX4058861.1 hypothetical protein [Aliarcobacter skirrowii]
MNTYDLFNNILHLETEDEVVELLKKNDIWTNPSFWKPYGGLENNIGVISNQQATPTAAFVEKIVNSIDALLMRECKREGINPESKNAPQSMKEAIQRYLDKFSIEDIQIYATGPSNKLMNLIIADYGEGQSPNNFENTLLSLNKSNKLKTPFVQGKFNMGSTGVIPFCGEYNIQLIASKKDPKIESTDELSKFWAFTITRKNSFDKNTTNSLIEYLVIDNNIPLLKKETLDILPSKNIISDTYSQPMKWGTYIKLYNYKNKNTSVIKNQFTWKLSQLLPSMPLTALVSDRRTCFESESSNKEVTLRGNITRLKNDKIEYGFPRKSNLEIYNEKIGLEIYLIKKTNEQNDLKGFKEDEGIAYIINGQVHGFVNQRIFSRKEIGLDYISKNILVYVDVSEIKKELRENLIMGNREYLRESIFKKELEELVIEEIKNCKALYIENEKVRKEKLKDKVTNDEHILNSLQKVLKSNPTIASLFDLGTQLPNKLEVNNGEKEKVEYFGLFEPTFFNLIKEYSIIMPKEVPINSKFKIQFKTDVVNDFFDRENTPGRFTLTNEEGYHVNYSYSLMNGKCTIIVSLPETVKIDEVLTFSSICKSIDSQFKSTFSIRIMPSRIKNKKSNNAKIKKDNPKLKLPKLAEIYKDEWESYDFDETSVLTIKGNDYFINMDNIHLKKNIKRNLEKEDQFKEEYKTMYLMYGIALEYKNSKIKIEENKINIEQTTSALAPVLFETSYIIEELRKLK